MNSPPSSSPPGYSARTLTGVFVCALIVQAWILRLPFQLDDYGLLRDPGGLFVEVPAAHRDPTATGIPVFMLRWTMWAIWTGVHTVFGASAFAYHAVSLLLHGCVSVLLTVVVARLLHSEAGARPWSRAAALGAGLAFGVCGGGIQAVSWTSANSDLHFPLFALLSLYAFLRARRSASAEPPPEGSRAWRALAFVCLLLCLLAKTPAIVVLPGMGALLWVDARRRRLPKGWWKSELALFGAAALLLATAKLAYLGTLRLRYGMMEGPKLAEAPTHALRGLRALGQALCPWNRDPIFEDVAPLMANFGTSGAMIALVATLPLLAWVAIRVRETRFALLLCAALTVIFAAPSGLLELGSSNNVLSRLQYLPLLPALTGLAIAGSALFHKQRAFGGAVLAIWAVFLLDGTRHVAKTELLQAAHQRQLLEVIDPSLEVAREDAQGLDVYVLFPDPGYGGIPSLGILMRSAFAPPFRSSEDSERLRVFPIALGDRISLEEAPPEGLTRSVLLVGPEEGAFAAGRDTLSGAELRDARRLRARSAIRPGIDAKTLKSIRWAPSDRPTSLETRWQATRRIPRHGTGSIHLKLPPGPAAQVTVQLSSDEAESPPVVLDFPETPWQRTMPFTPVFEGVELFGEPWEFLTWRRDRASAPALRNPPKVFMAPAALEPIDRPEPDEVVLVQKTVPKFRVTTPQFVTLPGDARLELEFRAGGVSVVAFSELPDTVGPIAESFASAPYRLHFDPTRHPGDARSDDPSWSQFIQNILRPALAELGETTGYLEWRISVHHTDGTVAAQTTRQPASFRLSD